MKRVAIYYFKDKDGIVDSYVIDFLKNLQQYLTKLVIVINGNITTQSKKLISELTEDILNINDSPFDTQGYKAGIEYLGFDTIGEFDELLLCNYTLIGPLYSFDDMFNKMSSSEYDFWGIVKNHRIDNYKLVKCKYDYIPEHIQTSFIVFNKEVTKSDVFKQIIDQIELLDTYDVSFAKFEAIITKELSDKGYKYGVYVDTDDLKDFSQNPLVFMPKELVKNRKCPIVKIDNFTLDYYPFIDSTMGQSPREIMNYISNSTNYNEKYIWEYIIRTTNIATIKKNLDLNYILPRNYRLYEPKKNVKVALMMHIFFEDLIDYCFSYAKSMPNYADIIITTDCAEKKTKIENKFMHLPNNIIVKVIENRGRDVSALLIGFKEYIHNYDYICFMHDKKTNQYKPLTIGESFCYKCFEGCLASEEYVENIISLFENDKKIGMLTPPPPFHGVYFPVIGGEWGNNFNGVVELSQKLKLNVIISQSHEPITSLGTMFWFRPAAMKTLIDYDWKYSDFPPEPNDTDSTLLHEIERIYGFVPQHEGYYTAWVMTDQLASNEITNYSFMLREIMVRLYQKIQGGNFSYIIYAINNLLKIEKGKNIIVKPKKRMRIRFILEKILPKPIFNILLSIKRAIIGPRNI